MQAPCKKLFNQIMMIAPRKKLFNKIKKNNHTCMHLHKHKFLWYISMQAVFLQVPSSQTFIMTHSYKSFGLTAT